MATFDRRGYFHRRDHRIASKDEAEQQQQQEQTWTWPGHVRVTDFLVRLLFGLLCGAIGVAFGYALRAAMS